MSIGVGVGFVGAGAHARHHMKEFERLGARLTRVFDIDASRSSEAVRDFAPLIVAASLDDLLGDSNTQAVVVATPAQTHAELAARVLDAGKHLLVEKPLAHTPEAARAIADAADAHADLVCMVGHCERFNPSYLDAKKAVDDGKIGEPRFAAASRLSPLHLNDTAWHLGTLDTAVHDMDLLLWLIGDRAVSVAAQGVTVTPGLSIPDNVTYQIRFRGGALAQGHIGWIDFGAGYPLRSNAHPRLFLSGTGGTLSVDLWQRPVWVQSQDGNYFWPDSVLVGYGDYFTEVTAQNFQFLRAVREGGPSPMPARDAYNALHIAYAAHESLTERGSAAVTLNEQA